MPSVKSQMLSLLEVVDTAYIVPSLVTNDPQDSHLSIPNPVQHAIPRNKQCQFCHIFIRNTNLAKHIKKFHPEQNTSTTPKCKTYQCPDCDRVYSVKYKPQHQMRCVNRIIKQGQLEDSQSFRKYLHDERNITYLPPCIPSPSILHHQLGTDSGEPELPLIPSYRDDLSSFIGTPYPDENSDFDLPLLQQPRYSSSEVLESQEREVLSNPLITQRKKEIPLNTVSIVDLKLYSKEVLRYTEWTIKRIKERLAEYSTRRPTRWSVECTQLLLDIQRAYTTGQTEPITAKSYTRCLNISPTVFQTDPDLKRKFVLCTMEEAREICYQGSPQLPLIIRGCQDQIQDLTIDQYWQYLCTKDTIDYHTYDQPWVDDYSHLATKKIASSRLKNQFIKGKGKDKVLNLLNLGPYKQNTVPRCLVGIPHYQILANTLENDISGKQINAIPRDLTAAAAFHALATRDAYSTPYRDSEDTLTTIYIEEGLKLWPIWPALNTEELTTWLDGENSSPSPDPFILFLKPGDLLIQPQGRVHAPYSIDDVLMTGTRHWDSRRMVNIMEAILFEREYPSVTNEELTAECRTKLRLIRGMMVKKSSIEPYYDFGGKDEEKRYIQLLKTTNLLIE